MSTAARNRQEEVEIVESAVRAVEPAERVVRDAERALDVARAASDAARERLAEARAAFQLATSDWRAGVVRWMERVRLHHSAYEIDKIETPPDLDGLISELVLGRNVATRIEEWIVPAVRHHEGRRADRLAALGRHGELVAELEGRAAELAKKQFPEPPVLAWQQRTVRCLAEYIDFAGPVEPMARAGLESALEASGLLTAEVHGDGSLRLADGQLLVMAASGEAAAPLSAVLRVEIPADHTDPATAGVIERILHAISTDPAAATDKVVAVDGEFRVGLIRGRHSKPEAEYIGVGARRAALERQRAECTRALEVAKADQSRLAAEVGAAQAALDAALLSRGNVPSDQALRTAFWRRGEAENVLEKSVEQLGVREVELEAAEQRHAEAVSYARIAAARLSLPAALVALRAVRDDIVQIISQTREARGELGRLARGVERWRDRGSDWRAARDDEQQTPPVIASSASMDVHCRSGAANPWWGHLWGHPKSLCKGSAIHTSRASPSASNFIS